jgi:hypothetical protein
MEPQITNFIPSTPALGRGQKGLAMRLYILLAMLSVIPSSQASQSSLVHCTIVVDDFGKGPIPHSAVRVQHWLYSANNKSQLIQDGFGFADDQGQVSFDLAPGRYEAFASAQAFVPAVAFVEVYPGMEKPYVFKLAVQQDGHMEVQGTQK